MTGLQDYLSTLDVHSPEPAAGYVTSVRVCADSQVEWTLLTETLLPADILVALEERLESHFGIREAWIVQNASSLPEPEETGTHAAGYFPWMVRHIRNQDPYLAALLNGLPCQADGRNVRLQIPSGCRDQVTSYWLQRMTGMLENRTGLHTEILLEESDRILSQMAEKQHAVQAPVPVPLPQKEPVAEPERASRDESLSGARYRYRKKLLKQEDGLLFGRFDRQMEVQPVGELHVQSDVACFDGWIVEASEPRLVSKNTRVLLRFSVFDGTGTISCHAFLKPEAYEAVQANFQTGCYARFQARIGYDGRYANDLDADLLGMAEAEEPAKRNDTAPERRVELHCHTKMSVRDAVVDATDVVKTAVRWGHPAVAITDHGVVQAFPEAAQALDRAGKTNTKLIYGVECYLVDDGFGAVFGREQDRSDRDFDPVDDPINGFVALDVETTGLHPESDRLIEVAAVRFVPDGNGGYTPAESFSSFIHPGMPVPPEVQRLTGVTDAMLQDAPSAEVVLPKLKDFIGDEPVCAHNAFFDLSFLRYEGFRMGSESRPTLKFNPMVVDTLGLSRSFAPKERKHKLNLVAERLGIQQESHHRAEDDARTCGRILSHILQAQVIRTWTDLDRWSGHVDYAGLKTARTPVYHCILLAADPLGLYNLYRLISLSHLRYFYNRSPRVPRSLLQYFRAGLIVGAACEAGEVFHAVSDAYQTTGRDPDACARELSRWPMKRLARFYDYLEIQPLTNNRFMLRQPDGPARTEEDLKNLNRMILSLGEAAGRPICATCDAHFLEKQDGILRKILTAEMFDDYDQQADLYFRTTPEMLEEFAYLGERRAREVVLDNPRAIADRVSADLRPFPDGFYPPVLPEAAKNVEDMVWETAQERYGRDGRIPDIVEERITRELRSVIDNGFATMYDIARLLVSQSNKDGYLVGSRGSVGSSFVATLCGITEVNPLAPHYRCPECNYTEFDLSGTYGSGYDLPAKDCPECGQHLEQEGQDIPFETFLGFDGDKMPDIDLNFSGEYQTKAHHLIEKLFGKTHTFKAGTISTYAEKNAMAMVFRFFEKTEQYATEAEKRRLAGRIQGVRQTTGQHPGAVVVVPKDREIYDFTPVHNPADRAENGIITTHFDFNSMHDILLKLDVLGKDDPTMMRFLQDVTGIDVLTVPFMDPKIMSLFTSTEALGIPQGSWDVDIGTLSLPEMGTFMARDMIRETKPSSFFDLVQLMGLSHGTNVWLGNAQDLIRQGVCDIAHVIGCRDSIMTTLIHMGLESKMSFDIMEGVRKGRGLTDEQEQAMQDHEVPEWYVESCKKISYMFPKAHAVAYAISALRLAWFKVYRPAPYYCSYFTVRADEFDCTEMSGDLEDVQAKRKDLYRRMRTDGEKTTALEERKYYILELIEEMLLRGIRFLPVDIYHSEASRYVVEEENRIRLPLDAVPGISGVTGERIVRAREAGPFKSQEELSSRAGIGSSVIATLRELGCLADMPETAQLDLFSLM